MVEASPSTAVTTMRIGGAWVWDRSCWRSGSRPWAARSPSSRAPRGPGSTSGSPLSEAPIRLVIADDHAGGLKGLESFLALEPDVTVAATATTGEATLQAVRQHRPDLLLLD